MSKENKFMEVHFKLEENIGDLNSYEEKHDEAIHRVWSLMDERSDAHNLSDTCIIFGESEDNEYVCLVKAVRKTKASCKEAVSNIENELKKEWPKTKSIFEDSGATFDDYAIFH